MTANGRRRSRVNLHSHPDYGVTATLQNAAETVTVTRVFYGWVMPALRELAEYCDRHEMYVVTLSTPNTIFSDIKTRDPTRTVYSREVRNMQPEALLLGRIARRDLIHPRLRA